MAILGFEPFVGDSIEQLTSYCKDVRLIRIVTDELPKHKSDRLTKMTS